MGSVFSNLDKTEQRALSEIAEQLKVDYRNDKKRQYEELC